MFYRDSARNPAAQAGSARLARQRLLNALHADQHPPSVVDEQPCGATKRSDAALLQTLLAVDPPVTRRSPR